MGYGFYDAPNGYALVGNIQGYNVYTPGVNSRRYDGIIGAWHSLPKRKDLMSSLSRSKWSLSFDDGSTWMNIQYDSWGASGVHNRDECAAITASIGSHLGMPVLLEVILDTGNDAGPEDIEKFAFELYDIVLRVLYEECVEHCYGVQLSYPHYL